MPSNRDESQWLRAWDVMFDDEGVYGNLNYAAAQVMAGAALSEGIRRLPRNVVSGIIVTPVVMVGAMYGTVVWTEALTSKEQAAELADWYANWFLDPDEAMLEVHKKTHGVLVYVYNEGVLDSIEMGKEFIASPQQFTNRWLIQAMETYG